MTVLLIAVALSFGALTYLVAEWATVAQRERDASLRRAAGRPSTARLLAGAPRSRGDLAGPVARLVVRLLPRTRLDVLAQQLYAEGWSQN